MAGDWIKVLRIVDPDRYEVNDKNAKWKPGDKKRRGSIPEIRIKNNGYAWGAGYRNFLEVAGKQWAAPSFGVFIKLLEIGGDQAVETRWLILDRHRTPADFHDIEELTGWSRKHIDKAIEVLTDLRVAWLEWVEWNPTSQEIRGIPGVSRPKTKTKTSTKTKTEGEETFDPKTIALPFPSDQFRQSWGDFCQHRQNIDVLLTELAVTRLLKKCERWGEETAIASIDASIESGKWSGLFPPKGNSQSQSDTYSGSDRLLK